MKRLCVAWIVSCILLVTANAQDVNDHPEIRAKEIAPYMLWVSLNQTSNLIFPYEIKSVDRGSSSIMAQKAKGAENVLQVKAASANFSETNLSVITADGRLYSFLLNYSEEPSVLNLRFYKVGDDGRGVLIKGTEHDKEFYRLISSEVKQNRNFLRKRVSEQMITLALESIYMRENTMFFKLAIHNNSLITYTPDYIKFIVKDRKKAKKTAIQEKVMVPSFVSDQEGVTGNKAVSVVLAFPSFTIPRNQDLLIQVGEVNGGRTLILKIKHKVLLKARQLIK
ncbi:conjugative transposon protein TraN [Chitinophaga terrae (ex Kim and Jung 2007)]|jgi:Bacteroides conjugative transposon TraN protein|uniref:conjugative transposon protein TraN n=1 Tax=Chitinophaga terrae (ex Kim and Jung 2007) TaxID=408074 RepID=UPI00260BD49A|nr:conjugative transposon protein TraN [Chitinophaga terrae (ex Kim and Jung 2007)]MDQ0109144.1 conjugative transposon TraN protein [Chitinophaga terrae (ex Kim and Jung 2007)]